MTQYKNAMTKSARAFRQLVLPILREKYGVLLHTCEGSTDYFKAALDNNHGCDYLYFKGGEIKGLASRVSFQRGGHKTMTFRKERHHGDTVKPSEYFKFKAAKAARDIYPEKYIFSNVVDDKLKSVVVDDKLKSVVVVRTDDLIRYVDKFNPPLKTNTDTDKNQTQDYWAIETEDYQRRGFSLDKVFYED